MLGKIKNSLWLYTFLPWVTLGVIGIILMLVGIIPTIYLIPTFVMWVLISGLGIAVGYHRVFSHRTHNLPTWKENIILFFATFACQGSPIFWTALHRGYHHPHSDTKIDLHSPVVYGRYHAFIGWFANSRIAHDTVSLKYSVDLLRKKNLVWFHTHYTKILWTVPLLVALFDWRLAFAMFWIPGTIGALQDNTINVYGHWKGLFGYRNYELKDNSHNNVWLGWFAWGQGWHNNHHAYPKSYDFGSGISGKWWEFDLCRIFLPFLGRPNQ